MTIHLYGLLLACLLSSFARAQQGIDTQVLSRSIQMKVTFNSSLAGDSLTLEYWDHYLNNNSIRNTPSHIIKRYAGNAAFSFLPPDNVNSIYLSLSLGKSRYLSTFLAEPGDSIQLTIQGNQLVFSGRGAAKYTCRYVMDTTIEHWRWDLAKKIPAVREREGVPIQFAYPEKIARFFVFRQKINEAGHRVLNKYRHLISPWSFQVLQTDLEGRSADENLFGLVLFYLNFSNNFPVNTRDSLRQKMLAQYHQPEIQTSANAEAAKIFSANYQTYLKNCAFRAKWLFGMDSFEWINKNFSGEQKEKLLTSMILSQSDSVSDSLLKKMTAMVTLPYWKSLVEKLVNHQTRGVKAYPFVLPDSSGKMIGLADLRGKVVMMDFWFTGCSGCAALAKQLPKITQAFANDKRMVFVSVSIDKERNTWINSLRKEMYTDKEQLCLYTGGMGIDHPMIMHYQIHKFPTTLIIDANGNIFSNKSPDISSQASINEYISLLRQALQ